MVYQIVAHKFHSADLKGHSTCSTRTFKFPQDYSLSFLELFLLSDFITSCSFRFRRMRQTSKDRKISVVESTLYSANWIIAIFMFHVPCINLMYKVF